MTLDTISSVNKASGDLCSIGMLLHAINARSNYTFDWRTYCHHFFNGETQRVQRK
jgi:hypothetical protein